MQTNSSGVGMKCAGGFSLSYDLLKNQFYESANKDLSNPDINCKKWWSIVNRLCGRESSSSIPPIVENEVIIFDSKENRASVHH